MIDQFRNFIDEKSLFSPGERILLAVSGGIDSMVMAHLFHFSGLNFGIAHCNFCLRGSESDGDEEFVRSFCRKHSVKLHTKRFNTSEYAEKKGISIQMAARELRYDWFEAVREENKYAYTALAHNINDRVETFIINLARGTGLRGLTGIKEKNGYLIRPLLFASREMIVTFAKDNIIGYREDSSNIETHYTRNKIRHEVIPLLERVNPSFNGTINETIGRLAESYHIYSEHIERISEKLITRERGQVSIKIDDLASLDPLDTWLFELFRDYGIGRLQVEELKNLLSSQPGKQLFTSTHRIIRDRNEIIIELYDNESGDGEIIVKDPSELEKLFPEFHCEIVPAEGLVPGNDLSNGYLDADTIEYPLAVRKWKEGDYFFPLGMEGKKKISDFLTDRKVPLNKKERVRVLTSDGNIIWVIGYRIDNRYRITDDSKNVLFIRWTGDN